MPCLPALDKCLIFHLFFITLDSEDLNFLYYFRNHDGNHSTDYLMRLFHDMFVERIFIGIQLAGSDTAKMVVAYSIFMGACLGFTCIWAYIL